MKKFNNQFILFPLAVLMAMVFSTSAFGQGNQPNSNTSKQLVVKQVAPDQQLDPNENYGYPWINYNGITDIQLAKSAWIAQNATAYQAMIAENEALSSQSSPEAIPLNDLCSGALLITPGSSIPTGWTTEATVDNTGSCGTDATTKGIWYTFVGTGNNVELSTCSNNYDTYMSVYSGSCGTLSCEGFNDDGCTSGLGSKVVLPTTAGVQYFVLVHGLNGQTGGFILNFSEQVDNPPLGQPCPLRLILVLDESGSIFGNETFVRSGVNAFVSGLVGTGTEMAIIEFTSTASRTSINGSDGFQTVDAAYESAVAAYLPSGYVPGGGTDWAAAFDEVWSLNDDEGVADLVIFFTDGISSLAPAIIASNAVKLQGSHLFMLGVGNGVNIPNLQAVSGPLQAPPTALAQADFGLQSDFADIEASLIALSTAFLTDYYVDNDGDGFGAGPATNECAGGLAGYVLNNDDCDDTNPDVYPGAPELCDGIANDCSNLNWPTPDGNEIDDDGDGFYECQGDCDDTNPNVYPGAPEICDGFDNDCSAAIDDADCDGVEDLCDVCPGGDDSIDADGDGLPDCAYPPLTFDPSWECDTKGKKVTICHVDEYGNRFELCVSKNAIAGHLGHGDFLGPCISCGGAKTINPNGNVLEELHVELFPVPANDVLTVDINSATYSNATISITDNLGRLVYIFDTDLASGSNVMEIDVSNYTSGVYMLKVESENSIESVKMIVQ